MQEELKSSNNQDEQPETTQEKFDGETVELGLSEAELEAQRKEAREKFKKTKHNWHMKGGWLCCDTCEYPHQTFLGLNKVMTGIDKSGSPILVDR